MLSLSKYDFGNEKNDAAIIFENFLKKRQGKLSYWQIVHLKSAAHEGYLGYQILKEQKKHSLAIHARHFFSVHSPLEKFLPNHSIYNQPIYNHSEYLKHYQELLEIFESLIPKLTTDSDEFFSVLKTIDLLRLQLYGFGRAALKEGYIKDSILAFKLADILNKKSIQELLKEYKTE